MTRLATLLLVFLAACGGSSGDTSPDASAGDAAPDGPMAIGSCNGHSLAFSRSEAEIDAALEALLADVQVAAPEAYYREAIDGTQATALLTGMHVPLAAALDEDPRPAALAWLAQTSPATLVEGEWTADPLATPVDPSTITTGDVLVATMARSSIDGVAWPLDYPHRWVEAGGLVLLIDKTAAGWELRDVQLIPTTALAQRADAELLAACSPSLPGPGTTIRATTFHGNELDQCEPVGPYTYQPVATDTLTWAPELQFQLGPAVGGRARWIAAVPVQLTIDPANYWPRIGYADCLCGDEAAFTLLVDALTGEVLRATPGPRFCVVC